MNLRREITLSAARLPGSSAMTALPTRKLVRRAPADTPWSAVLTRVGTADHGVSAGARLTNFRVGRAVMALEPGSLAADNVISRRRFMTTVGAVAATATFAMAS